MNPFQSMIPKNSVGTSSNPFSSLINPSVAPKSSLMGSIGGAAKAVGNAVISSEKGVSNELSAGLTSILPKSVTGVSGVDTANANKQQEQKTYLNLIHTAQANGDTDSVNKYTKSLQDSLNEPVAQTSDLYPGLKDSDLTAVENLAGTAADVLTAGTYGSGAKGLETGVLAASKETPTIIKGAEALKGTIASGATPFIRKRFII
jgi:hypothetical protein